jgi:hypothetical protein
VLPYRLDSRTLVARNFYIKAWRIWTMTFVIQTMNLIHVIFIYEARVSGP